MTHETGDIADILKDEDRILIAAWMLPNEGPLTEQQRKAAMANFAAYLRRHDLTSSDVARQIGKPKATTIGELTKGTYRAGSDDHIRKLNNWLEQHARSAAASLTDRFVSTKVAKDIFNVARLCREHGTLGLLMAPTGTGKTRCALALHDKYPGSIYLRIISGTHHPKGLTSALAEQLGVRRGAASRSERMQQTQLEQVIGVLRNSSRLLLIDEASKLTTAALELLRDIHDTCGGLPMVFFATRDLHDRIVRNADPDHGQLYSRFDVVHHLTEGRDVYSGDKRALYTVDDIKALYNEPPVKLAQEAARHLQQVANMLGYGSLRRCKILLQSGVRRARKRQGLAEGDKVTVAAADLEYVERVLRRESSEQETIRDRRRRAAAMSG